jgi:ABC-type multidrug transport system ATPase subunit
MGRYNHKRTKSLKGSGKTTLLNTIARRVTSSKLEVTGQIVYSGVSAYVMQQDILLAELTVRETLTYAANLRLPHVTNSPERKAIVESVILELGLKDCANTRIGSSIHKGCSGGEKRRVSIGVQMLANPSVLFCDEPTTGLRQSPPRLNHYTDTDQDLMPIAPSK